MVRLAPSGGACEVTLTMLPIAQLEQARARHEALTAQLADPAVARDPEQLRRIGQEQAELQPVVAAFGAWEAVRAEAASARELAAEPGDPELAELATAELEDLAEREAALEKELVALLVPKDPRDQRSVIVEIRAGTGGDEAALFAADLFRMYGRYAEGQRWAVTVLNHHDTGIGGFKEIIFEVKGKGAFSRLKWESGVHRVQRVPDTEAAGRIHTSTATVAVLPEMDEVEVQVPDHEIRVDVFRSSGPGGQSVNTTDSAVRITHLPTGIVVSCQDEKSQLQNRQRALAILRARLHQIEVDRQQAELTATRRSQVGSGERSEKIRTYNFPQTRVTDHRIGLTSHRLAAILDGDLDEFIDTLSRMDFEERLAAAGAASGAAAG
jgi:peptide chain release factor 1